MNRNSELKEIRRNKRDIYKGLRALLSTSRRLGKEFGEIDLLDLKEKDDYYVAKLFEFIWGINIDAYHNRDRSMTYLELFDLLRERGFSDDVCQFMYKVDKVNSDNIYVVIFKDKFSNKYDRVDIFVVNTCGEKR